MDQPSNGNAPASFPVSVIGPQFQVPRRFDILVHTSSISSGNLFITDINNTPLLKVQPDNTNLHHQRILLDVYDTPILKLREKHMTGHARWKAFRGNSIADSDMLFTTKKSHFIQGKTCVSVFLASTMNNSEDCEFKIKGSWSQRNCAIYVGDSSTTIAQMQPWDVDSFLVTVDPNVDYAFVVALIAIVDAMKSSERKDKIVDEAKNATKVIGGVLSHVFIGELVSFVI